MFEGLNTGHISFILVFLEGVISFFSPCVIPLIPVYMSYLAGNAKKVDENGVITYGRKKVFLHTFFFVLGISFAFFILGMTFSALGQFFNSHKYLFTRIGGILIILFGLFQLGILDFKFLQRERKVHLNLTDKSITPFLALIMGFTFSFAWTPCIGPALSSVLILASGAKNAALGNLLVLVYALGFVIPFLLLGLFTARVLAFLKAKQKFIQYTIKAGGILLILLGIMTFTGWMNGISSYLNSIGTNFPITNKEESKAINGAKDTALEDEKESIVDREDSKGSADAATQEEEEQAGRELEEIPAIDFTLTDQYGNVHTLSDYKGKVVFLNFWATWCPPCKKEMPHIEELYQEFNLNEEEVVILGVANPKSEEYPNNSDETKEDIIAFLEENEYTFPTVFDETGEVFSSYYISAFPTTFLITKDGNVLGYVPGMMTKDVMQNVIDQTLKSTE
ncbi:cytochrome c biogenesis protein CcsB [Anaerocolumna cellulosilytica]|uniref:Cytochrome c biogenesis protein CcsB n=1 Tax=Anaerocolumna cellulosilytica TaxID=433286 RepID=A0A6S6R6C1_9FIRM|nr:cytochrome c biogenesis protein/redoxin [Anaerocolumna cellulosilytica]MBB5195889.1 cytochrome c-type biogenesis protein [Anaerocolumna cellulosilytica]BCJ96899.1 cytochrome c biogenesis protein CcsB [Anaerocolumna cellulosilytica]